LGIPTLAVMISLSVSTQPTEAGDVNFFLGQKQLEGEFDPIQEQPEFGAQITVGPRDWPVKIAIDILASSDDDRVAGVEIEASTSEIDVGARRIWIKGKARPFFGGGLALVNAELQTAVPPFVIEDDDSGVGLWISGGAFWRIGARFNVGVEARISRAEVKFFGRDTEVGGEHFGVLLGWGW